MTDTKEFHVIKDYPDYMINPYGEIISFRRKTPTFIKGKISNNGYRVVGLINKNGERKHLTVHRLVAITFIENKNEFPVINHKDGNKLNNHVENLEWCSISYNTQHAYDNGFCIKTTKKIILFKDGIYKKTFLKKKDCVEYLMGKTGYSFDYIRKVISGQKKNSKEGKLYEYTFIVEE